MQISRTAVIASVLAVLAVVAPLIVLANYAQHRAVQGERSHLLEYSQWTLLRAERNLQMAKAVFARLETERRRGCSDEHIARMRQLTLETRAVDEIGYFTDGRLACTSWGMVAKPAPELAYDAELPGGYRLSLDSRPEIVGTGPMLAIRRGNYKVLMRPERLVDVLTDADMALGIATKGGKLLAMTGNMEPALAQEIASPTASDPSDGHIHITSESGNFRAFALSYRAMVAGRLNGELWLLLPIGLAISALLVGLIVWVSRQRLSLEHEVQTGIRQGEFSVFYQPIMELATGHCVGAEALLRWRRPDGRWIPPDIFIPIAEHSGLIEPLTDFLIETVARDLAVLLRRERRVHIAINISSSDLQSGRFLPVLETVLARTGVEPSQIWLEATERGFIAAQDAKATLDRARASGHLVAIDDFGTGYSSLSLLEVLPLDALKIDKSFVQAVGRGAATSMVMPYIIEMAHGFKFDIVAEGVETLEQEEYLREAGVQFAQGWRYAPALVPEEFLRFYEQSNEQMILPLDG